MNKLTISNEAIAALDKAAENSLIAQKEASQFKRTLMVADSINELRRLLTPEVMTNIMRLQNSAIGFRTDNPAGYTVDVVTDCVIEATFKGVYPVGNEFNILKGRCYITKEGFRHKLRSIPGLSWMEIPGIPRMVAEGGAVGKIRLEWTLNGEKRSQDLEIAIRVNKDMGIDAIIGKLSRKARAWLYTTITGQDAGDGDAEDDTPIDVTPQAAEVKRGTEKVADLLG